MKQKLTTADEHFREKMRDPEFRRRWELTKDTGRVATEIMKYRISHNFTQSQAAKELGMYLWELKAFENFDEDIK